MTKNWGTCIMFICIGAVLGGILGELLRGVAVLNGIIPYLAQTFPVFDVAPTTINLYVIKLTVGCSFAPNLMSFLGIVLALLWFKRY